MIIRHVCSCNPCIATKTAIVISDLTKIVLSTRNPGKVEELMSEFSHTGIEIIPLSAFPDAPDVEETADTLEGNAALKAEQIFERFGIPTLADDTGLEVEALGGAPGVMSARYAGPECNAVANCSKLLKDLENKTDRSARFRTVLAFTSSEGTRLFEGECEGEIAMERTGDGGFGYDPIFRPLNSRLLLLRWICNRRMR